MDLLVQFLLEHSTSDSIIAGLLFAGFVVVYKELKEYRAHIISCNEIPKSTITTQIKGIGEKIDEVKEDIAGIKQDVKQVRDDLTSHLISTASKSAHGG